MSPKSAKIRRQCDECLLLSSCPPHHRAPQYILRTMSPLQFLGWWLCFLTTMDSEELVFHECVLPGARSDLYLFPAVQKAEVRVYAH